MERWDRDAIDLVGPTFIEITANDRGSFRFIAAEGFIDARHVHREVAQRSSSVGTDVAELSERLVLFACAKTEDPDVTVNEDVTMPGYAGATHAFENDLDSPGRHHPGWLAFRRPWRGRPEDCGRCDRRATIDVPPPAAAVRSIRGHQQPW
jgi:hypothetical protein